LRFEFKPRPDREVANKFRGSNSNLDSREESLAGISRFEFNPREEGRASKISNFEFKSREEGLASKVRTFEFKSRFPAKKASPEQVRTSKPRLRKKGSPEILEVRTRTSMDAKKGLAACRPLQRWQRRAEPTQ
jgi:hypothetical protein